MKEHDAMVTSFEASESLVRLLLDTTPIGLALSRLDGSLVEVNPAFAAITGHSVDEILGLNYWDITPSAYHDQEQAQLEMLKQTGRYGPYEKEFLHKDGHAVPVRLSGRLIESEGQQYIWSTVEDLSAIRESKMLSSSLSNILEHSFDEIYIFDSNTLHFLQVSKGALMNLGYSLEEMREITPAHLKPDYTEQMFNDLIAPLRTGDKKQLVFGTRHERKDGSHYPVEVRLQFSGEGTEAVFFAIILDLTERKQAEEALRLTQFSLDRAPDSVFWMQEDGSVSYVNDEGCRSLGYSREELLAMHVWDFDPDTQAEQWQQHWEEMRQLGHNTFETRHRSKDGLIHPVEISVVRTSYGGAEHHSAFVRDITKRKHAEDEMRRSNAVLNAVNHAQTQFIGRRKAAEIFTDLLNSILELSDSEYGFIGEVMYTDDGRPYIKTHGITNIAWNDETRRFFEENAPSGLDFYKIDNLFGYAVTHREIVIANDPATDPRSAGVPEGHPPIRSFMGLPFFNGTDVLGMIAIANRPGGYDESLLTILDPLLIASKNIIGSLRVDQQRMAAEEALRDLNEELEERVEQRTATVRMQAQIIDQTHDSVITTDLDGMVTSWNGGAERLFGIFAKDALDQHISFIYPEDQHQFLHNEIITPLFENGQHDAEVNMLRADGTLFPAHLSLSLLYDDEGAPRGMVGYSIDISEQKKREQKLDELAHRLQASNKELESFSYSVSHDLRAPLRAIDGFSLALAEDYGDQLDQTAHDYLQRVRRSAQRMGMLIDDMLQLSRVNRQELDLQEVDLGEITRAVMEELQESEPERKVELTMDPDLQVQGDPRLLRVMMDNLLGNAWKFTSRETHAHIIFKHKANDPQVLYIHDNGVGFDMRHADKLFGAFQRLHRSEEFPGTGVGLATVQRIVHRHGGRVWAEAHEGEGATFYFSLGPHKGAQQKTTT